MGEQWHLLGPQEGPWIQQTRIPCALVITIGFVIDSSVSDLAVSRSLLICYFMQSWDLMYHAYVDVFVLVFIFVKQTHLESTSGKTCMPCQTA